MVSPANEWCNNNHDRKTSLDLTECPYCENWATKQEIEQLGCCWTCDKRQT